MTLRNAMALHYTYTLSVKHWTSILVVMYLYSGLEGATNATTH